MKRRYFFKSDNAEQDKLTSKIIKAGVLVHKELGQGLLERIYEDALCYELDKLNLNYERQKTLNVSYKDTTLNATFRLDLLVEDNVIVELKNCEKLLPIHEAQLLTYLKITNKDLGLLLNFHAPLMKQGIKRVQIVYNP